MRAGVGTCERTKVSPDECHVRPCRTYPSGPLTPAVGFLTRNRSRAASRCQPVSVESSLAGRRELSQSLPRSSILLNKSSLPLLHAVILYPELSRSTVEAEVESRCIRNPFPSCLPIRAMRAHCSLHNKYRLSSHCRGVCG